MAHAARHVELPPVTASSRPEVWLRGPLPDVPALLQPVAHSLLQCREEVDLILRPLTAGQLHARPGGIASVAYHAVHAVGSLERLLTYARGEALSGTQLRALAEESNTEAEPRSAAALADDCLAAIDRAVAQLVATPEHTLLEPRHVGRARLPSTVLGLLFHAAEHTQRHVGQLVTTAKVVGQGNGEY